MHRGNILAGKIDQPVAVTPEPLQFAFQAAAVYPTGRTARDLMAYSVEKRFGTDRAVSATVAR